MIRLLNAFCAALMVAGFVAIGRYSRGNWSPYYLGSPVTHWHDIEPPTE